MPRPAKLRRISQEPHTTYFKPQGIPISALEEIVLTMDECEALRLADLDALSQEEAAEKMKISRATFGRIIEKARRTMVDALVHGKALLIEGGNVRIGNELAFQCKHCHRRWQFRSANVASKDCPQCKRRGWSQ
jgi:predicted DNA-binding protein (UPF0251 family)